jgi:hypothetical protein
MSPPVIESNHEMFGQSDGVHADAQLATNMLLSFRGPELPTPSSFELLTRSISTPHQQPESGLAIGEFFSHFSVGVCERSGETGSYSSLQPTAVELLQVTSPTTQSQSAVSPRHASQPCRALASWHLGCPRRATAGCIRGGHSSRKGSSARRWQAEAVWRSN